VLGVCALIKIEMTPKEKAKELIEKFSKYAHWDDGASNNDFNSVNCAIIACDELILQSDDANFGGFKLYWQAVKSELLSF
jgi:peptide subunit release factor 1 (eRF1)